MDIITPIKELVTGLPDAEEDFWEHLDPFPVFAESVHELRGLYSAQDPCDPGADREYLTCQKRIAVVWSGKQV